MRQLTKIIIEFYKFDSPWYFTPFRFRTDVTTYPHKREKCKATELQYHYIVCLCKYCIISTMRTVCITRMQCTLSGVVERLNFEAKVHFEEYFLIMQ